MKTALHADGHRFDPPDPKLAFLEPDGFFSRRKARPEPFVFYWFGLYPFHVTEQDVSDGLSIPVPVSMLSFGKLDAFMPGVVAGLVHDPICKNIEREYLLPVYEITEQEAPRIRAVHIERPLSRGERALIFKHALECRRAGWAHDLLWRGVRFGSRYLGAC